MRSIKIDLFCCIFILTLSVESLELPGCKEVCNMYPPCPGFCVDRCGCCTFACPMLGFRQICAQSDGNGIISNVGRCFPLFLNCHLEELVCLPRPEIPVSLSR